jgi:hypothetical protein
MTKREQTYPFSVPIGGATSGKYLGRPTIPFVVFVDTKGYSAVRAASQALFGGDVSHRVLAVPIRNDPEMVVKVEPRAVEAGLQKTGAAT